MDNKEKSMTNSPENKLNLKPYRKDIYFITVLIILTILFPFGVIWYLWGRMNLMIHFLVISIFPIMFLMLVLIFVSLVRLINKNTRKKNLLVFIEICLSAIFIISFFVPGHMLLNFYDAGDPFLCGYRDRIRSRLDIKAVRAWMKTYSENYTAWNNDDFIDEYIPSDKLPNCLKPIRFGGVFIFRKDPKGNLSINQSCGATFYHWGLTIGLEDTPFPDSEFYKEHGLFWLPVAPGIYVDID